MITECHLNPLGAPKTTQAETLHFYGKWPAATHSTETFSMVKGVKGKRKLTENYIKEHYVPPRQHRTAPKPTRAAKNILFRQKRLEYARRAPKIQATFLQTQTPNKRKPHRKAHITGGNKIEKGKRETKRS